jgi:hypothetical protein
VYAISQIIQGYSEYSISPPGLSAYSTLEVLPPYTNGIVWALWQVTQSYSTLEVLLPHTNSIVWALWQVTQSYTTLEGLPPYTNSIVWALCRLHKAMSNTSNTGSTAGRNVHTNDSSWGRSSLMIPPPAPIRGSPPPSWGRGGLMKDLPQMSSNLEAVLRQPNMAQVI